MSSFSILCHLAFENLVKEPVKEMEDLFLYTSYKNQPQRSLGMRFEMK